VQIYVDKISLRAEFTCDQDETIPLQSIVCWKRVRGTDHRLATMKSHNREKKPRTSRPRDGDGPTKKLSHALSWALRHQAPTIGLTITPAGWVPVQEILESMHPRLRGTTLQAIEEAVATSDKKRFALSLLPSSDFPTLQTAGDPILCIRASQGHSIRTIDPNLLLTRLSADELRSLPCIVHGTNVDAWKSIEQQGLKTMTRTHIHFATGLPEDDKVISGMRRSATICIYIDPESCIDDGIEFFISANGVILTDGIDGILGTKYFLKVTDSTGNIIVAKAARNDASNADL
jgi:2'-phosphotransferase